MLTSIQIDNFTLVEQLEIDLDKGLTAITGETGTGKSLVLDALAMALGDRADTGRIRQGAERATIAATFDLGEVSEAQAWLEEQDFPSADSECLLRRSFNREGRSKGYINGQAATMLQLRTLGEMLVDIHSQHEHQSLLRTDTHRALLDNFAQSQRLAAEVRETYRAWQTVNQQLEHLEAQSDAIAERRDLLSFQLDELDQLNLKEGELEEIESEHAMLSNADALLQESTQLMLLLQQDDDGSVEQRLGAALRLIDDMIKHAPSMNESRDLINSALIEVQEAAGNIARQTDQFQADPARLEALEEKLAIIHQLARKHRVSPEELPAFHRAMAAELESLGGEAGNADALREKLNNLADNYRTVAKKLTAARKKAAAELESGVNQQLDSLSMKSATLKVSLKPLDKEVFAAHGRETVELLIATNPGQPHGQLAKIASGGELSRVSLAIQVVAAERCHTPTLIFDEVDVGIGGHTARVVGNLLRKLGEAGQVICVTHLPQVASAAHQQLLAVKTVDDQRAESALQKLGESERVAEIARMLGGDDRSAHSADHAREMLSLSGT
ncbi:MAG: DNA repair protein RecN [bacterium]